MTPVPDNGRRPLKVSLIITLKNEAKTVKELWRSISAQTRLPDELVVVDGGSKDGTVDLILSFPLPVPLKLEVAEGANIAEGRNLAISMATSDLIAVTDGGCVLDQHWLERLVEPLERDRELGLAAGFYMPLVGSWYQGLIACATLPLEEELNLERFMPSSRSVVFRKEVWESAGGYPEWLKIGEDMYFNHAWKEAGVRYQVVPEALVYWRQRSGPQGVWKQYFRYAEGDGIAGMYPERHLARFSAYGWLAAAPWLKQHVPYYCPLTFVAALAYGGRKWRRIPVFLRPWPVSSRFVAIPALPGALAFIDVAKMAGYISGRWKRLRGARL